MFSDFSTCLSVLRPLVVSAFGLLSLLSCEALHAAQSQSPKSAALKQIGDPDFYRRHIIAVDGDGSALEPTIRRQQNSKGEVSHKVSWKLMEGENTRNPEEAKLGRKAYYTYLDQIFTEIDECRRAGKVREVVVYVHGGLNSLDGAMKKAAALSEVMMKEKVYGIFLIWNSELFSTYGSHLGDVREGLSHKGASNLWLPLTIPLTLVSDIGCAIARTPATAAKLLRNDAITANPDGFFRHRQAEERFEFLRQLHQSGVQDNAKSQPIVVSRAPDSRTGLARSGDTLAWVATLPVKAVSVPLLDTLGYNAWNIMLRRTRTMWERQTDFVRYPDELSKKLSNRSMLKRQEQIRPDLLNREDQKQIAQFIATGRPGAATLFFEQAQKRVLLERNEQPRGLAPVKLTLIGHSMGAIVLADALARYRHLPVDNVVFMAAACSINDFKLKVVPYLQEPDNANTRFYNLCLHDNAERGEKNPGATDFSARGSLLVWIDTFFQEPESESDRTFGRWENAILATDTIPQEVTGRITLKAFGRARAPGSGPNYEHQSKYRRRHLAEPGKHGEFSHYSVPTKPAEPNFAFWERNYRELETP